MVNKMTTETEKLNNKIEYNSKNSSTISDITEMSDGNLTFVANDEVPENFIRIFINSDIRFTECPLEGFYEHLHKAYYGDNDNETEEADDIEVKFDSNSEEIQAKLLKFIYNFAEYFINGQYLDKEGNQYTVLKEGVINSDDKSNGTPVTIIIKNDESSKCMVIPNDKFKAEYSKLETI